HKAETVLLAFSHDAYAERVAVQSIVANRRTGGISQAYGGSRDVIPLDGAIESGCDFEPDCTGWQNESTDARNQLDHRNNVVGDVAASIGSQGDSCRWVLALQNRVVAQLDTGRAGPRDHHARIPTARVAAERHQIVLDDCAIRSAG